MGKKKKWKGEKIRVLNANMWLMPPPLAIHQWRRLKRFIQLVKKNRPRYYYFAGSVDKKVSSIYC
jgi:hypothetical protein